MGRKQLREDYAKATAKYGASPTIKDLQLDGETIAFKFEANGKSVTFTLSVADEYPENSTLYPSEGEPQYFADSIVKILDDICEEYSRKFSGKESDADAPKRSAKPSPPRFLHDEEEEDHDGDGYSVDFQMSPHLTEEMAYMRQIHGDKVCSTRTFGSLDMLDLDVHVAYAFNPKVAAAWGMQAHLPVTVRLHIIPSVYLDAIDTPKVSVVQDGQSCGLSTQLSFIVKTFCQEHWSKFAGQFRNNKYRKTQETAITATASTQRDKKGKQAAATPANAPSKNGKSTGKLKTLVDMGFDETLSESVLEVTHGDVDQAADILVDYQSDGTHVPKKESAQAVPPTAAAPHVGPAQPQEANARKDIIKQAMKDSEQKDFKVDYADGFLPQVYKYVCHRLMTLNHFCIICDRAHLFASVNLIKPAVCTRELCTFAFQSLGVCAGATDGIAPQAEVVDLLVCMARAAAKSSRNTVIFDPYPTVFNPNNQNDMILNPSVPDFEKLKSILANICSISDMMMANEAADIKDQMDRADVAAFPLLQWIINSNRAHIEKIHPAKQLQVMKTPFQYVLVTAAPEKEATFNTLKAQYGTTFAFHGSPVENWHCILRVGLKNASGTRLQMHGAAYGSGIYLSPSSSTSFGYLGAYNHYGNPQPAAATPPANNAGNRYLDSSDFFCIALCEVVNIPDIKKNGDIWVCPNESAVLTRFFFAYPRSAAMPTTAVHTSTPTFLEEIQTALKNQFS